MTKEFIFIDLEASSLGSASFPTEIGWAWLDSSTGIVSSGSRLIRPTGSWVLYSSAWSAASERLTGITRAMLEREGVSPDEAMRQLIEVIGVRQPLSDAPGFDEYWLAMLAEAANAVPIKLGDARAVIRETASRTGIKYDEAERESPVRHRAEADARRLVQTYMRAAGL
jgi:hypothetical protein